MKPTVQASDHVANSGLLLVHLGVHERTVHLQLADLKETDAPTKTEQIEPEPQQILNEEDRQDPDQHSEDTETCVRSLHTEQVKHEPRLKPLPGKCVVRWRTFRFDQMIRLAFNLNSTFGLNSILARLASILIAFSPPLLLLHRLPNKIKRTKPVKTPRRATPSVRTR